MSQITFDQLPSAVAELLQKVSSIENILRNQTTQPETDQYLTIQQTGELIKLSVPTIYGYVSRNAIPFSKKGKRLYFSKMEIMEWIKQGKQKTHSEIAAEAHTYLKRKKE